jgi:pimeloyl-ACP methyl ester carboxylesterase
VEVARGVGPAGIDIAYEQFGEPDAPPVLLIMGLGAQMLAWPDQFCVTLAGHGLHVIRFDNRDIGLSSHMTDAPPPDVQAALRGRTSSASYTLSDMAADAIGLMDALGFDGAHLVGVSMGGMIAQELALQHPRRVRSVQLHCTLARPDRYMHALMENWRVMRAKATPEEWMRIVALWLFSPKTFAERPELVETIIQTGLANPHPFTLTGFLRQGDAVRSHDTLERLAELAPPALVSVADDDILVPPRFSRQLAGAIPGATLKTIDGAGHCYFWERPDVFNAMCLEFLARHAKV